MHFIKHLCLSLPIVLGLLGCSGLFSEEKKVITTPNALKIGPFSQGIKVGNVVFLSGQIPMDLMTGEVNTGSIEEQTKQVLENLKAVLAASNMDMSNIVSTTVYLSSLNDFPGMNSVYSTYFPNKPPARATVQVAGLVRGVAVEISAIAVK